MGLNRENRENAIEWDLHEEQDSTPIDFKLEGEISPDLFGIEPVKAKEMVSGLSVTLAEREVLKKSYVDVIELPVTAENLPAFKELRLKIMKNRTTGLKTWHTGNKAFYLAGGRFVDAIYNKEVLENEQMETKLLNAEKYFDNLEKERLSKLKAERNELLQPFVEVLPNDLETLNTEVFDSFLATKKAAYESKLETDRIEAERLEAERIEKEKEIEAQRLENERLKKEAAEKEAQLVSERKAAAEAQAAIEEKARKDAEVEKAKQEDILKAEREAKSKLEAELKAKKDAEKAEAEAKLATEEKARKDAEKAAKAPIKKQLEKWVDDFALPPRNIDNDVSRDIVAKFIAFKQWSINQVNNL